MAGSCQACRPTPWHAWHDHAKRATRMGIPNRAGIPAMGPLLLGFFGLGWLWSSGLALFRLVASHLIDYPTPVNLNPSWNWGSLAGLAFVWKLVSGIFAAVVGLLWLACFAALGALGQPSTKPLLAHNQNRQAISDPAMVGVLFG